jgi:hypothetical protein
MVNIAMAAFCPPDRPVEVTRCTGKFVPEVVSSPAQVVSRVPVVFHIDVLVAHWPVLKQYFVSTEGRHRSRTIATHASLTAANICKPGGARFMYVKTSSSGPIVIFVMIGELVATRETLYGFCPPEILMTADWQVSNFPVTYCVIVMFVRGGGGRHPDAEVLCDAS